MCDFEAEDILAEAECNNEGGLIGTVKYAYAEDIEQWPAPEAMPSGLAQSATLSGDFVMKAGKYFAGLEGELEMCEYKGEGQGNAGPLSARSAYTFRQQSIGERLSGFINASMNRRMAIVFKMPDGRRRVIGTKAFPARMASFSEGTGLKQADARLSEFEIAAQGRLPMYFEGEIPLEPELPQNLIVNENGSPIGDENGNFLVYE